MNLDWIEPKEFYQATCYRRLVSTWIETEKKNRRYFSYRELTRKVGFKSPNFFQLVLTGKRNLGFEGIAKLSKLLKIGGLERQYFEALIQFNQAQQSHHKEENFERLLKIRKKFETQSSIQLPVTHYEYLSNWIYVAVREYLIAHPLTKDVEEIAAKLCYGVSSREVEDALNFLLKSGLLQTTSKGFVVKEKSLSSSDETKSLSVQKFHSQILELAKRALGEIPLEEREFGALTFALSMNQVEALKSKMKTFRRELLEQFSEPDGSPHIYQFHFSAFPLTKSKPTQVLGRTSKEI